MARLELFIFVLVNYFFSFNDRLSECHGMVAVHNVSLQM